MQIGTQRSSEVSDAGVEAVVLGGLGRSPLLMAGEAPSGDVDRTGVPARRGDAAVAGDAGAGAGGGIVAECRKVLAR